jgi:hypothetical protein
MITESDDYILWRREKRRLARFKFLSLVEITTLRYQTWCNLLERILVSAKSW